jgi:hypothetical protein
MPRCPVINRIEHGGEISPTLDRGDSVIHKGIQYFVSATTEADVWHWRFQIAESVRTGKTKTRLATLAARRVQIKINAALKVSGASSEAQSNNRTGSP